MLKLILILIALLLNSVQGYAQIKVAVIDSGLEGFSKTTLPMCKGSFDFTGEGLDDKLGHGTNVAHLIHKMAHKVDYCQIHLKTFVASKKDTNSMSRTILALEKAVELGVDVINYSASGPGFSGREAIAINTAIDKGIVVVVAAGNDGKDLSKTCDIYPACYNRKIVVVGCIKDNGQKCEQTNYGGPVDLMAHGFTQYGGGYIMSGTSQATANVTGMIVRALQEKGKKYIKALLGL